MPLTLVIMAAGLGSRFGGPKHLAAVGPSGEALLDYAVFDAARAGFGRVVLVIRREFETALRDHARAWFPPAMETRFAEQRMDDVPSGFRLPAGRAKPWGTGQAVLAARQDVDGPFAVCNADDFYGAGAFRALAEHLTAHTEAHALAGYRLSGTLSEHGGVSRALCECDADGRLRRIVEVTDLRRRGGGVTGRVDGGDLALTGTEGVSMNLWGFHPSVLPVLARQFAAYLTDRGDDPAAEFLLATAVNEQVVAGQATLQVLAAPERWFGLTFAADLAAARDALAALVRAGTYPADLRGAHLRP